MPSPEALLFRAAKAFRVTWSKRKWEAVSHPFVRIRHRSGLTERDWENAVQGLGKSLTTNLWYDSQITLKPNPSFYKTGSRVSKIFKGCMSEFFFNCLLPWPLTLSFLFCPRFSFRGVTLRNRKEKHTKKPPATQASVCDTPSVRLQTELRMLTLNDVISRAPQTFSFLFCSTRRKQRTTTAK